LYDADVVCEEAFLAWKPTGDAGARAQLFLDWLGEPADTDTDTEDID
jgi:hypothetical protein